MAMQTVVHTRAESYQRLPQAGQTSYPVTSNGEAAKLPSLQWKFG